MSRLLPPLCCLAFLLCILCPARASSAPKPLGELIEEQFSFASAQYKGMLSAIAQDTQRLPRSAQADGTPRLVPCSDWTSGFFPGSLWLVYEQTHDPELRRAAEDYTQRLEPVQRLTNTHDLGFMLMCSYGEALRITGDKAYEAPLLVGARSLATRFNLRTGLIRSWDEGPWKFPVIIDNMMNLELLVYAAGRTGEVRLREIAVSHADRTLANHFRSDGSSFHLVDYDPTTGAVIRRQTVQGFADASSWARGQAWGLYGYTTMYRLTNDKRYLEQACRIADYLAGHSRLPADGIPYWDFDDTRIPNAERDASAGALMSAALLELSGYCDPARAERYLALSERELRSLCSPAYRAKEGANAHFLIMHCVGHKPAKSEIDVPLNYADYYFLQALGRWKARLGAH
jgi:rhamnogalacturonyl hydrolase YesR